MATGVHVLKLAAGIQEWSTRIAECRSSGMSVRDWCKERRIKVQTYYRWEKRFVEKAAQQCNLSASAQTGFLMRIQPEALSSNEASTTCPTITIRHGESVITLPAGSSAEAGADLVKALNRHVGLQPSTELLHRLRVHGHAKADRRIGSRGGAAIPAKTG